MSLELTRILELFALLFSRRWIGQWQTNWELQKKRGVGPAAHRPAKGAKKPKNNKKKEPEKFYERIFSLRVTLWYLLYQRLNFDVTLAGVMTNLRAGGADRLGRPRAKPLSKRSGSQDSSAYNQARQRLPLALLQAALERLGQIVSEMVGWARPGKNKPAPLQRPRQLLDGSTLSVLKTPELAAEFPPAANQNGSSDWCMLRILVGFCARSGAVLSAIEGAITQSEQALAWVVIENAIAFTIWIGDRNFGVWSVVAQAVRFNQGVLVRLTKARAAKLAGKCPLSSGQERAVAWSPPSSDQTPPGAERKPVRGRLIYVRLCKNGKWIDLWLFTTLEAADFPLELLVPWYGQRWQAELHFRSVKTQMKMVELKVCTPSMARKEFYAGVLAYSLVRAVMWAAGERLENKVQTLSFNQARRTLLEALRNWVHAQGPNTGGDLKAWAQALLEEIHKCALPKRRQVRPSEIRCVRHRRDHFPRLKGSRAAARIRYLSPKSS